MRSQSTSEEQPKEKSPSQTQDPIERRRLQNRLSQRNHRRKIRDRIAKLQERVIASELRAAASMNGWDQTSPSAVSAIEPQPQAFDGSPLSAGLEASSIRASPHRSSPSTGFCPGCSNILSQLPAVSSVPSSPSAFDLGLVNGLESANSSPTLLTTSPPSSQLNSFNLDGTLSTTRLQLGNQLGNDINFPQYPEPPGYQQNQQCSHYYVATEASLPQIMQTLSHGTSRPKAIILIPQGNLPEGIPPTQFGGGASGDSAGLRGSSSLQSLVCHCSVQDNGRRSTDLGAAGDWISSSSSFCPLHSVQSQPVDGYQRMML